MTPLALFIIQRCQKHKQSRDAIRFCSYTIRRLKLGGCEQGSDGLRQQVNIYVNDMSKGLKIVSSIAAVLHLFPLTDAGLSLAWVRWTVVLRIACQANSEVDAEKAKKVTGGRNPGMCEEKKNKYEMSKRVSSESKYTLKSIEQVR